MEGDASLRQSPAPETAPIVPTVGYWQKIAAICPGVIFGIVQKSDGSIVFEYVSPAAEVIHELSQMAILENADLLFQQYHPDDREAYWQAVTISRENLSVFSHEWRIITPSGRVKWLKGNCQPELRANGEVAWYGMVEEITQEKLREIELAEWRDRYQLAEQASGQVLYEYHFAEDRIIWGTNAQEILGYAPEQLPLSLEDFNILIHPENYGHFLAAIEHALQYQVPFSGEYRLRHQQGHYLWIEDRGQCLINAQGEMIGVIGMLADVTDRKETELTLIKLKKLHREAQRIAKLGNWELDLKTNYLYWSEEIFQIFEINPQQFAPSYEGFLKAIHPDDREKVNDAYRQHLHDQTPYQIVHRLLMPDGRVKYVQEQCETVFEADGTPLVSQGTVQDITQLRKTEEALKEFNQSLEALVIERTRELKTSESRFRRLFDLNVVGIIFTDFTGAITDANDCFLEMIGYSRAELEAGQINWQTLTPPEYIDWDLVAIAHLKAQGAIQPREKAYYHKQGHLVPVLIAAGLIANETNECICLVINISDRKQAELQLQNLSERLTLALQAGAIGSWEWHLGATTYWDQENLKLYGLPTDNSIVLFEQWIEYVHPEDREFVKNGVEKIVQIEPTFNFEFRIIRADGELRWIQAFGIVQRDRTGQAIRIVGINRDITEQKNYENNLKKTNLELERLLKLREETLQFREDMANMIIHDLRNPLSSILLTTNLIQHYLEADFPLSTINKKLPKITESGQRMQHMIDSLLIMAKLEAGKILLNPSPTDLHELGNTIVNDLELSATVYHVTLQANLPQPGQTVIVDAQLLRRIIENLLTNAIKFSPPYSPVTFTLEYTQDNHLKVTVADLGSGISEENQQRIFNRFEIGDLKANIPQIGLGLAFCKMAVEAQGGKLAIASNTPRGSVFTVEI
ncbi:MAG: PAS domain-containing protein [Merismopediaceae bacterium]|nr:PAS domain-containing protein [Merismopediaceae bacterium]